MRRKSTIKSLASTSQFNSNDSGEEQCRACNPHHKMNTSYPDKRAAREGDEDPHLICCTHCDNWYHCECVDLEPYETFLLDIFSCKACEKRHGPSSEKPCVAPHRLNYDSVEEKDLPVEVATKPWIAEFIKDEATKFGPPPPSHFKILKNGVDLARKFDFNAEWKNAYLIKNKDGLGMQMPAKGKFYIDELIDILGGEQYVETIDVYTQVSFLMSLNRFRRLLMQRERPRLYNILSLEFSGTKLTEIIRPPSIVQRLSWAERYWPTIAAADSKKMCDPAHAGMRPYVEHYCLAAMGGSFTDFHIDMGGSSVWYHVYRGEKIFYLVEPTSENLDTFQRYRQRPNKEQFLGDIYGDQCWRVVLKEGMSLMLPAGWLHAVYTPVDSLVFGGNYLTDLSVELQCEVNAYENRFLVDARFSYHNFEIVNWYAARSLAETLKEYGNDLPPLYLIRGTKALVETLGVWIKKFSKKNAMRAFIFGRSQSNIYHALARELKSIEKRMGADVAQLEGYRMSHAIARDVKEEEKDGREEGDTKEEEEKRIDELKNTRKKCREVKKETSEDEKEGVSSTAKTRASSTKSSANGERKAPKRSHPKKEDARSVTNEHRRPPSSRTKRTRDIYSP